MSTAKQPPAISVATLLVMAALIFSGCRMFTPWETVKLDTPWIAPGVQATQRQKSVLNFMACAATTYRHWGTKHRRGPDCLQFRRSFEDYMQQSGWLSEWQPTGSWLGDINQRIAPYRFTIVAIRPAIIAAVPLDLPPDPSTRDIFTLIDRPRSQRIHTDYLVSPLEFGTTIPLADTIIVVDVDSGRRCHLSMLPPITSATYKTERCALQFTRSASNIEVTRLPTATRHP